MTSWQSCLKKKTRRIKRRCFEVKSENTLKSGKSKLWPSESMPLIFQIKRKRSMILVILYISTAIKKVTIPAIVLSQKISISLSNFYISNRWG